MLRVVGVVLALLIVVGLAADAYAQSFFDSLPSINGLDSAAFAGDTIITDKRGVILADVGDHGDHRLAVRLNQIAPVVIQATVAIEDRGFYTNPGFDISAIVRAAYDNLKAGHIVSGASTITQQLAKQQFLTPDQSVSRKLRELALAYELSQAYTKDQIMELYLNKSFYGSQSYGIEAAAQSYFHIHAAQLDLAQASMLAGLPQAPTEWNPVINPDAAKQRQTEVLQAMVRSDFISQADMDTALAEKLVYQAPVNSFKAPHFVDYVLARAATARFPAGRPAAERQDHARLQDADDRREDRALQPGRQRLARPRRPAVLGTSGRGSEDRRDPGDGRLAELQRQGRPDQLHDHPSQHGLVDEAVHVRRGHQRAGGDGRHARVRRPEPPHLQGRVQHDQVLQLRRPHARRAAAEEGDGQLAQHRGRQGRAVDRSPGGADVHAQPRSHCRGTSAPNGTYDTKAAPGHVRAEPHAGRLPDHAARARRRHRDLRGHGRLPHARVDPVRHRLARPASSTRPTPTSARARRSTPGWLSSWPRSCPTTRTAA